MREVGSYAPAFALACHDNGIVKLSRVQERSNYVVLIFFLVASSPGCTMELKGFVDLWPEFEKRKVGVIAISPDNIPPLAQFAKEIKSPFDLCSDMDHHIAEEWGVWSERGQMRATFILSDKGVIIQAWPRVNVYQHAADVLRFISEQMAADEIGYEVPPAAGAEAVVAPAPGSLGVPPPAPAQAQPAAPAAQAPAYVAAAPVAGMAPPAYPQGGYPGPGAAGQPGYPGAQPAMPGYPGGPQQAMPGYPAGPQQAMPGYPGGQPAGYPGSQPGGYPGAAPGQSHPGLHPAAAPGYPGSHPGLVHPAYGHAAPHPGPGIQPADLAIALARTSLLLLLQHLDSGGQVPPDLVDLAARLAYPRYGR